MFSIIVFLPLLGFLIAGIFGKFIGHRNSEIITSSFVVLSAILSWICFFSIAMHGHNFIDKSIFPWLHIGSLNFSWTLKIDTLTCVMFIVVCSISALVHIYSIGYMHHDKSRSRFFSYLSLFTFMMLMLITSNNLIQMFFGWEGVGLASYLLIGFWYEKDSANKAAMKAFIVNRVGDFAFLLGIFSVYLVFDSVNFSDIFLKLYNGEYLNTISFCGFSIGNDGIFNLICLLLFVGAMGKSAQFLLHVWLPDAMEGPTPVSALIHAATMVTAGIFMIARLSPLFENAGTISTIIMLVGSITAFFAATVGLVQNDIKRVIAYSTCSQLGYMFVALGARAYSVGVFHLFTHAFFKALLFLGAGSVIHAVSGEQDMRKMGGLLKHIPITYVTMLVGTFALTGLGIPGTILGTAGFFSKDAIIEASYASDNIMSGFAFWSLVIAALFTSFYSWRVVFMTFHGKPRAASDVMHHVHESGWVMLIPLFLLSFAALTVGAIFKPYFAGDMYMSFWRDSLFMAADNGIFDQMEHIAFWVKISPFIAMCLGFILSYIFYILRPSTPAQLANCFPTLYKFLLNKWYVDELYSIIFVKPIVALGRFFWEFVDINVIDRLGPNGIAARVINITKRVVRIQTGYVYHYAFVVILGAALLLTWIMIGSYI